MIIIIIFGKTIHLFSCVETTLLLRCESAMTFFKATAKCGRGLNVGSKINASGLTRINQSVKKIGDSVAIITNKVLELFYDMNVVVPNG